MLSSDDIRNLTTNTNSAKTDSKAKMTSSSSDESSHSTDLSSSFDTLPSSSPPAYSTPTQLGSVSSAPLPIGQRISPPLRPNTSSPTSSSLATSPHRFTSVSPSYSSSPGRSPNTTANRPVLTQAERTLLKGSSPDSGQGALRPSWRHRAKLTSTYAIALYLARSIEGACRLFPAPRRSRASSFVSPATSTTATMLGQSLPSYPSPGLSPVLFGSPAITSSSSDMSSPSPIIPTCQQFESFWQYCEQMYAKTIQDRETTSSPGPLSDCSLSATQNSVERAVFSSRTPSPITTVSATSSSSDGKIAPTDVPQIPEIYGADASSYNRRGITESFMYGMIHVNEALWAMRMLINADYALNVKKFEMYIRALFKDIKGSPAMELAASGFQSDLNDFVSFYTNLRIKCFINAEELASGFPAIGEGYDPDESCDARKLIYLIQNPGHLATFLPAARPEADDKQYYHRIHHPAPTEKVSPPPKTANQQPTRSDSSSTKAFMLGLHR